MMIPTRAPCAIALLRHVQALRVAACGQPMAMSVFLLGVNYWPRRSAMYMWERFDLGEIREDMARIKSYGLELVRFFLTLGRFPARARPHGPDDAAPLRCGDANDRRCPAARDADALLRAHERRELAAGLVARSEHAARPLSHALARHDLAVRHRRLLSRPRACSMRKSSSRGAVGERAREHPALYAWDLGNEFSNLREPQSPEHAAQWSARLTTALL